MKKFISLGMVGIIAMSSGCASIVSKSQWPVTLNSTPSGAQVTIKNKKGVEIQKVTTPTIVKLDSGSGYFARANYTFLYEKPGYCPMTVDAEASFNTWYVGNLVFGGLIGMLIVDPLTGAMWKMENTINAEMKEDGTALKGNVVAK